ncbi:MAG: hypothetical protein HKP58_12840, partial [Desulfatitalea sp.]|nr:hypothetical protein [Desulfatitalea sp.]
GDSLWNLSCRYLGSGARWRGIFDGHNDHVAQFGPQPQQCLFAIKDPNLIYVGQLLMIPSPPKHMPPGTDAKAEASQLAVPLNLKVTYTIGRDTPPVHYESYHLDFTIKTELTGEIGIEHVTLGHDRYIHNLELALSKDPAQIKQKLNAIYDPAVRALSAKPEMVYESGHVKIKAPHRGQCRFWAVHHQS